jgi:prevent-host-death family protein
MTATTSKIPASEAKAKFSELLERTRNGEGFSITLHGEEVANLLPAKRQSLQEIRRTISAMEELQRKTILNPPGKPKLRVKDLINEGRR